MESTRPQPVLRESEPGTGNITRWTKTALIALTIGGLGALNIATLVSESIHNAGYNLIRSMLSVFPEASASRLLNSSPTVNRSRHVARATEGLRKENTSLVDSNRAITGKHNALEKAHAAVNVKHAELTRTTELRSAAAKKLTTRLATRSAVNATRNLASVPGEAIPYVGIGIVVAVTSLDLYDACETLKDINEMNLQFGHELEDHTKVCGLKVPTKQEALAQVRGSLKGAYASAADVLNTGREMIPTTLPRPSWSDVKGAVCPVIGDPRVLCP